MSSRTIVLLGPQRLHPNLAAAVDACCAGGQIAAVTAGWQEREEEDQELRDHLGRKVVNLMLHRRGEEVFAEDRELFLAHRARQDELRELQRLYRLRLDYALAPARRLLRRRRGTPRLLISARASAIEAVRSLDREHLSVIRAVHRDYQRRVRPTRRPAVARHRRELQKILADCSAVAIAGGHVAVLLNRLRLFGLGRLIAGRTIFAWSAGAMALSERVVLFHDSPPQGAGNPEVLEAGLGLVRGLVLLPHARRRLRLGDAPRVALFARRFAPAVCLTLDEGAHLDGDGRRWQASDSVEQLVAGGGVEPFPGCGA
ncbi:MAG: hypothetical protein D6696_04710 [Acidobacteria bacterium]|nr:MAG: hypothetical protein D6696_04710 [Acidobacteriota bacterium]